MTNFKKYILTILVTVLFVFSLCFCVELELLFRCERKINQEELQIANLDKFYTIDDLEKKLSKEPKNYIVSLKLAQIYESLGEYKKAHEFYKNALKLSGKSNLTIYHFAMFCARQNLNIIAAALCEDLSGSNKKTLEYKTKIYEAIADSFTKLEEYPAALKAYQIAFKYAKNINDKNLYLTIKEKYCDSYIKLADYYIKNSDPENAATALLNAIKLKETPYADYRLALIYLDLDKKKAQKYMTKAFEKNPFIVNPFIYNKLLNDLITETKNSKNQGSLNFYSMKLNRFKKTLKNSYVYKNDIIISNSSIQTSRQGIFKKEKYFVTFDIKNNTKQNINDLFVKIELYVDSKKYEFDKKIFTTANSLNAYDSAQSIRILLPYDVRFDDGNDIVVRYHVKKKTNAPWVMVKIDSINF